MANSKSKKPTQEVIDACLEELCTEIVNARSDKDAACIKKEGQDAVWQYKVCCLDKAQNHLHTYRSLNLLVATPAQKQATLIKDNVKKYITKSEELSGQFKDTVKGLKQVKTVLEGAVDEACKLERCWEEEERCNPDLFKVLDNLKIDIGDDKVSLKSALQMLEENVTVCYNQTKVAFNAGVEIVGLQTFANVNSLESVSKELCEKMDALKANIDDGLKASEKDVLTAVEELVAVTGERKVTAAERCEASVQHKGIQGGLDFICLDKCPDLVKDEPDSLQLALEEICAKVKKDFGNPLGENPFDCCPKPDGGNGGSPNGPSEEEQEGEWVP